MKKKTANDRKAHRKTPAVSLPANAPDSAPLAAGAEQQQTAEPLVNPEPRLTGDCGRLCSLPQARKMLYDFMDRKRPWASCKDVYAMMEEIVDFAAFAFRGELRPKKAEVDDMRCDMLRITAALDSHPEDYDGPCACAECRSYGD